MREAPLYLRCHDLCRQVLERFGPGWGAPSQAPLRDAICVAATQLLCSVSLALTFRPTRAADLLEADRALVRLRVQLRLARDLGALSPGGLRHLAGTMTEIGRMIGGWRKQVSRSRPSAPPDSATTT